MTLTSWKVIRAADGRLAIVDIPNPSRPVLFEHTMRGECERFVSREEYRHEQRIRIAGCVIWAAGVVAALWLALAVAKGFEGIAA